LKKFVLTIALVALSLASVAAFADEGGRKVVGHPAVSYPELAKRMHISGSVKVEVTIASNGHVLSAKALGGHPLLVDPAVNAVKSWHFETAAGETTQVVTINFTGAE
jgi:TonB family protein